MSPVESEMLVCGYVGSYCSSKSLYDQAPFFLSAQNLNIFPVDKLSEIFEQAINVKERRYYIQ